MQGISIREFARREECSDTLVRKALKSGHLTALDDGTLNPDLVGTGWRKGNRQSANGSRPGSQRPSREPDETPEEAADRIVNREGRAPFDLAEAERIKENYLALLRQLEYDLKSGEVVPIKEVADAVGQRFSRVRTRLLALPAKIAPRIVGNRSATEIKDHIEAAITEALEELTYDGPAGGGAG